MGSALPTFLRVLARNKVDPSRWFHAATTFGAIVFMSPFQLLDDFYFRRRLPEFEPAQAPLFIIGHWRSGTTLLHNMLSRDKRAAFVTTYHSVFPLYLRSRFLFGRFMKVLMPEHRPGDNIKMNILYPQEDEYALSNLTPRSLYHAFYFPKAWRLFYEKYVRFQNVSAKEIMRWKKKYSEMVKRACMDTGGEWPVLKNPVNTGRIKQLLELYPDARFVYLVRHPVEVYCSSKKFFSAVIPTLSFQKISDEEMKDIILDVYEMLLKDYLSTRHLIPENRLAEVRYEDLMSHPAAEIERIYRVLELGDAKAQLSGLHQYLEGQKSHSPDVYKLSKKEWDNVLLRWDFAMQAWGYGMPENVELI